MLRFRECRDIVKRWGLAMPTASGSRRCPQQVLIKYVDWLQGSSSTPQAHPLAHMLLSADASAMLGGMLPASPVLERSMEARLGRPAQTLLPASSLPGSLPSGSGWPDRSLHAAQMNVCWDWEVNRMTGAAACVHARGCGSMHQQRC
jgi:hypothetical protein